MIHEGRDGIRRAQEERALCRCIARHASIRPYRNAKVVGQRLHAAEPTLELYVGRAVAHTADDIFVREPVAAVGWPELPARPRRDVEEKSIVPELGHQLSLILGETRRCYREVHAARAPALRRLEVSSDIDD